MLAAWRKLGYGLQLCTGARKESGKKMEEEEDMWVPLVIRIEGEGEEAPCTGIRQGHRVFLHAPPHWPSDLECHIGDFGKKN